MSNLFNMALNRTLIQKPNKTSTGGKVMLRDDVDSNENSYEDEENDIDDSDFPVLKIQELRWDVDTTERPEPHVFTVEKKTIQSVAEIVAVADKHKMGIHVGECFVMEAQIDLARFDLSFSECVFREEIRFKNGFFTGKLRFWDSSFEKEADFSEAIFKGDADFSECTFEKDVNFTGATFEKRAAFSYCEFDGRIAFDNATFTDEVDFRGSTFCKKATYRGTVFEKGVDPSSAIYKEGFEGGGLDLGDMKRKALADQRNQEQRSLKKLKRKSPLYFWSELDKVSKSKQKISRRQMLRGIFRFLPEDKKE